MPNKVVNYQFNVSYSAMKYTVALIHHYHMWTYCAFTAPSDVMPIMGITIHTEDLRIKTHEGFLNSHDLC